MNKHKLCVAPMFKYTDKHCRYFHRLLTKKAFLYTEMITTNALLNKKFKLFKNKDSKKMVSLQIIGNKPKKIAKCAKLAYKKKYNEINLNIGCPSIQMNKNNLGVTLMKKTKIIVNSLKLIKNSIPIPISIKTRIGFNNNNTYNFLSNFVYETSKDKLCKIFIIHARNAILNKFSPKKNREIPPLKYKYVYQLKKDFPNLTFIINGGIKSIKEIKNHLKNVNGVMLGRYAYKNPLILKKIEEKIFKKKKKIKIKKILFKISKYINKEIKKKTTLNSITRHINGIFYKKKNSKKWKKFLNEINKKKKNVNINLDFKKYLKY
ncbi:MAG: tRNA dihydrouridine(20/20a) synthase DusA [Buchnera aphidicola (Periphyllus lyropictus)]|uniref:tRNA dihydrouridine(20/20a) synthase DusA n=1 Tax=Buchnera aphidicola TaxID=9 RepID=UPI001EC2C2B1|nr:tRNA dihydrouridine(20/20a) synthase DusA [Buchnera aphidicola]NIH16453.1 tRNA dihydrouridine(20/20a) synthase DusA [Buchnera aphidicola (Periphyllus lyropictus)]USS94738.1 tRNA dihydrouridine(20/20a) synthase DusA [Buchnera aphidicola (Periphyllus lyropictus)]